MKREQNKPLESMPLELCVNSQNQVVDHVIQPLFYDFTLDRLMILVEFLLLGSNQGFWGSFLQQRGKVCNPDVGNSLSHSKVFS